MGGGDSGGLGAAAAIRVRTRRVGISTAATEHVTFGLFGSTPSFFAAAHVSLDLDDDFLGWSFSLFQLLSIRPPVSESDDGRQWERRGSRKINIQQAAARPLRF